MHPLVFRPRVYRALAAFGGTSPPLPWSTTAIKTKYRVRHPRPLVIVNICDPDFARSRLGRQTSTLVNIDSSAFCFFGTVTATTCVCGLGLTDDPLLFDGRQQEADSRQAGGGPSIPRSRSVPFLWHGSRPSVHLVHIPLVWALRYIPMALIPMRALWFLTDFSIAIETHWEMHAAQQCPHRNASQPFMALRFLAPGPRTWFECSLRSEPSVIGMLGNVVSSGTGVLPSSLLQGILPCETITRSLRNAYYALCPTPDTVG
jgi:hypothetical protein